MVTNAARSHGNICNACLQLDYLDLDLVHWPNSVNPGPKVAPAILDTWRAMEKLVEKVCVCVCVRACVCMCVCDSCARVLRMP